MSEAHSPITRFPYERADYEEVLCNLCGRNDVEILAATGRGKIPVRAVICRFCGLIYINPRMTGEWYEKFYDTGYREETARMKGGQSLGATDAGLEKIFQSGFKFGSGLIQQVGRYLKPGLTIEVGSSAGGVLSALKDKRSDIEVMGIEPSPREADFAENRGIKTIVSLFENLGGRLPQAANIVIARSLNHLLDPKRFFSWAHENLLPDGRLIVAVQDFRLSAKKKGSISAATQIDHTYMFTKETLENFLRAAGFKILFCETSEEKSFREWTAMRASGLTDHMRFVAVKENRRPFSDPSLITPLYPAVRRSFTRREILRFSIPFAWRKFNENPKLWFYHRLRRLGRPLLR